MKFVLKIAPGLPHGRADGGELDGALQKGKGNKGVLLKFVILV